MALQLAAIVDALGGELHGDRGRTIERLASLQGAGPTELSFLSNPKFQKDLAASRAGCVIVSPAARDAAEAR
ncbi:MAG TPA: LpxD N-terminal domain-containing protein, partial [Variovorax sp.]|nr:LpxD N-terminal domain-containing protein [Variovorax sp.]